MTIIPEIEVQKLLHDLWAKGGLSDAKIGKFVETPGATINRLRLGVHKTTTVDRAIRIANFHAEIFKKKS